MRPTAGTFWIELRFSDCWHRPHSSYRPSTSSRTWRPSSSTPAESEPNPLARSPEHLAFWINNNFMRCSITCS
jgi:hypothetical protein